MKCNIFGHFADQELIINGVQIEYADTGNPDSLTITLKRGAFIDPALMLATIENFADITAEFWNKYGSGEERAINIVMPKANFWIEISE